MRKVEKRKFSCFYDTQLPTVCRLPFAVNVMLNLSNDDFGTTNSTITNIRCQVLFKAIFDTLIFVVKMLLAKIPSGREKWIHV